MVFFCGAPFLARVRVCLVYMLLVLASAVFLGSESLWTHYRILLSQIETFFFVASYDSQVHGGGIRPRLHTGNGSWFSLYSLGADRIESTASNSSSVFAYVSLAAIT
jgi:hypothetical protein